MIVFVLRTIVTTPVRLVPLGDGKLACPETFRAVVEGDDEPFVGELEFRVLDGAVRCVSLCLHAPDGGFLSVVSVRDHVALKRWTTQATQSVVMRQAGTGFELPDDVSGREVRLSTRTRASVDDTQRLAEVAKVYNAAKAEGSRGPVQRVATTLHYSPAHAQRLVNQARRAGLLRGEQ